MKAAALALSLALTACSAQDAVPSGVVEGVVRLADGVAPSPRAADLSGLTKDELAVAASRPSEDDPSARVAPAGGVPFTLVWLESGPNVRREYEVPEEPVVVEISGMALRPRVLGAIAGQRLVVHNRDRTAHAVHAQNLKIGMPETPPGVHFDLLMREWTVRLGCQLHEHPHETGWVRGFKHPYFCTTDENGRYRIEGLDDGTYELHAWHETYGRYVVDVTIAGGKTTEVEVRLDGRPKRKSIR